MRDRDHNGLLIVFEGGEGAGKTTQVSRLTFELVQAGITPVVTREPGATPLGSTLRQILLGAAPGSVCARAEALLYAADRALHVAAVLAPALAAGKVAVCDRFTDSSIAYQGFARGLGPAAVSYLSEFATAGLTPDLVVVLDIDPRTGLHRAAQRGIPPDRIEAETLEFHDLVRAGFLARAQQDPGRYLVLDACEPPEATAAAVATRVWNLHEQWIAAASPPTVCRVISLIQPHKKGGSVCGQHH